MTEISDPPPPDAVDVADLVDRPIEPEPQTQPAPNSPSVKVPKRSGNPVVWREMYTRFASMRTAFMIVLFLLMVGFPVVGYYAAEVNTSYGWLDLGQRGIALFEVTLLITLCLILFVTPLQAAGSIAMERDRMTLMPMQISLLRPWQIAVGKIRVAASFSLFLVFLSAPLLAIAFTIGSVSVTHLILGMIVLLATVILATTVTVFCSSLTKRTTAAAFMALILIGLVVVIPTIGFTAWHSIDASRGKDPVRAPKVLLATNPVMALADAVGSSQQDQVADAALIDRGWDDSREFGPLSELRSGLVTEQDGRLGNGFGSDSGFGPVPATMVELNGNLQRTVFVFEDTLPPDTVPPDAVSPESLPAELDDAPLSSEDLVSSEDLAGDVPAAAIGEDDIITFAVGTTEAPFGPVNQGGREVATTIPGIPLWIEYLFFVIVVSALATWGTTRRLRTPATTER